MSNLYSSKLWSLCLLLCMGCGHSTGAVEAALLNTAVAMGTSAASRASGGCYAACPVGTTCNEKTGMCDTLPCRGECNPYERCEENGLVSRCVPMSMPEGSLTIKPAPARPQAASSEPPQETPEAAPPSTTQDVPKRAPADAPRLTPVDTPRQGAR